MVLVASYVEMGNLRQQLELAHVHRVPVVSNPLLIALLVHLVQLVLSLVKVVLARLVLFIKYLLKVLAVVNYVALDINLTPLKVPVNSVLLVLSLMIMAHANP